VQKKRRLPFFLIRRETSKKIELIKFSSLVKDKLVLKASVLGVLQLNYLTLFTSDKKNNSISRQCPFIKDLSFR
jgi:hypothetical protein